MWVLTWGFRGAGAGMEGVFMCLLQAGSRAGTPSAGLRELLQRARGGGLGSEPSCLTLPRLLAAAPHLCTGCSWLTHTWLAEPLLWNYLSMSEVGL